MAGTSQLRISEFYAQGEVGDGLRESFNGDFSCCTIEISRSISGVDINALLSESEIP